MEANLVPGMTDESSYFPKACEIENSLSYDKIVKLMLSQGISRIYRTTKLNQNMSLVNTDTLSLDVRVAPL